MKTKFTTDDLTPHGHDGRVLTLENEFAQLVLRLLPWQEAGLQQTASGYGKRMTSAHMVHFEGRLRRIYTTIYSNAGTSWFLFKGEKIIVR